jgi:hypothetical protein
MTPFELRRHTSLDAAEAWHRLTTWERHADGFPLTQVRLLPGARAGVGTRFAARTSLGPVGYDDVMEVVEWRPPRDGGHGFCRIEKRGHLITGWAEITVTPDDEGSIVEWREVAQIPRLGRLGDAPGRLVGRLLFGRLVDRLLAEPV